MQKHTPEQRAELAAAFARYDQAHSYGPVPISAKIKLLMPSTAAPEKPEEQTKFRYRPETAEQWRERAMQQYHLRPLEEAQPAKYDVTDPARYQRPPTFAPAKSPLVKNVSRKRYALDAEEQRIDPEQFRTWRESLGMSTKQLAGILRVNERTIRNWETGRQGIPFMLYWAMQAIKPEDCPTEWQPSKPTRYYKPEIQDAGKLQLQKVLQRYAYVMKPHGITSDEFRSWRIHYMFMTPDQVGQLLRVPPRTINRWESGEEPIPFSVWWVMNVMLQDPEVFLSRPGFHDFYIEYHNGEPMLCSSKHPEIRCTPTDLYLSRAALKSAEDLNAKIKRKEDEIAELQAENTRLRQMLKAGTVTAELKAMQDHIADLLKRVHTADVVAFPEPETAEVINIKQAAA